MRALRRAAARLLIVAAPSVPLELRGRVAIQSSTAGARGEAGSAPAVDEGSSEGGVLPVRRPPTHPDLLLNWRPAPENRVELSDAYLAGALPKWRERYL